MPVYRFEDLEQVVTNPHLSTGKGGIVKGHYISIRNNNKEAGTGSQLHYHPNELMIFPIAGRLNAVVGKDHRIIEPGTFIHVPPNARHAMRATEDGPVSYLYVKDNTWTLTGIAADEAPPEEALDTDQVLDLVAEGRYPGQDKAPEASEAIVEGLNDCYYGVVPSLDEPVSSTRSERRVEGLRVVFRYVDAPNASVEESDAVAHETFLYVLRGTAKATLGKDAQAVHQGDLLHIAKGEPFRLEATGGPIRYAIFESTPFLESKIDA